LSMASRKGLARAMTILVQQQLATRLVQRTMRRYLAAQQAAERRQITAARLVQSSVRRFLAARQAAKRRQITAARLVQGSVRRFLAARQAAKWREIMAARLVQSSVQRFLAARQAAKRAKIVLVQAHCRRIFAQQRAMALWRRRWIRPINAVVSLQGMFRERRRLAVAATDAMLAKLADKYEPGIIIGEGTFGVVWRVTDKISHQTYAVKEIDTSTMAEYHKQLLRNEVKIMRFLRHTKGMVYLEETFQGPNKTWLVMEECTGGDLQEKLDQLSCYDERAARELYRNLLGPIDMMHKRGVAHLDIKAANVLLVNQSGNTKVKLADFGLAGGCAHPIAFIALAVPRTTWPQKFGTHKTMMLLDSARKPTFGHWG
jgi:Protein kinase domain